MIDQNPWNIQSLFDLQYFNCPSCLYKDNSRQEFVNHAYKSHPESKQYLSNIKDRSMSDLMIPLMFKEEILDYDDNLQESDQNLCDVKNESNDKDQFLTQMVKCYYCSKEMDRNIVRTHMEKSHPSKPVIFNIMKDITSALEDDKIEIIDSIKDEIIDPELNSVIETEYSNEDVLASIPMVQCYYCKITIIHSEIRNHIEEQHPSEEVIYIPIDSAKMDEENDIDTNSGKNTSTDQEFHQQCSNCNKKFRQDARLKAHQKRCGKNKLKCDYCEEKFSFHHSRRNHILDKHKDAEKYKCDMCEKEFTNPLKLKSHKLKIHEGLNCEACGKSFKTAYNLKEHISRVHEGHKDHKCTTCNKLFFSVSELKKHITAVHKAENPVCEECGKSFNSSSYLENHIKNVHKGKGHMCDTCGKSFNYPRQLRIHKETVHKGRKDNICHLCGKGFSQKTSLKIHMRSVHEGKRDHKCHTCGKLYAEKRNMLNHIASVHEGRKLEKNQIEYPCPTCGKIFFTKNPTLKNHILDVHEGRKHDCNQCDKSFSSFGTMRQHVRHVHEGVPHKPRCRTTKR